VMLLAKYVDGPLKLYAGYEQIRFMAPSDPQTAFTDIAGTFLCQGCDAFNNTNPSRLRPICTSELRLRRGHGNHRSCYRDGRPSAGPVLAPVP
jgi:hypothetical protein